MLGHASLLTGPSRTARHGPERVDAATEEAFHRRLLAQCAVGHAQVTDSCATLTPAAGAY